MLDSSKYLLGLATIVMGCLSSACGFLLMKRSGQVEAQLPCLRRWRWMLGFLCLAVVQTVCDAMSLSLLPLSVVAPFAGLTIVFSCLLAASGCCGEAEAIGTTDLIGGAATLVGIGAVSTFAPHEAKEVTLAEASSSLIEPAFAVPFVFLVLGVGCCLGARLLGRTVHVMLCAGGAATCAALSQLALKLVSLAVREAVEGGEGGMPPLALIALAGLGVTAPSQLTLLNAALGAAKASVAVPLYQGATVSLTTLSGGLAFHEFGGLEPLQGVGYTLGLVVATAGLLVLARGEEGGEEADDEEEEEQLEVGVGLSLDEKVPIDSTVVELHPNSQKQSQNQGLLPRGNRHSVTRAPRRNSVVNRLVAPPGFMLGLATAAVTEPTTQRQRSRSLTNYAPPPFLSNSETSERKMRPRSMTTVR